MSHGAGTLDREARELAPDDGRDLRRQQHDRFLMQMSVGTLPHASIMRSIELLATEVAPVVRRELAGLTVERSGAM